MPAGAGGPADASRWLDEECRDRNIGYSIGYWVDHRIDDEQLVIEVSHHREAYRDLWCGPEVAAVTTVTTVTTGWGGWR